MLGQRGGALVEEKEKELGWIGMVGGSRGEVEGEKENLLGENEALVCWGKEEEL